MSTRRLLPGLLAFALVTAAPVAASAATGASDVGVATWYGGWRNGHRTSSGTIFNENAMTAASATLPLGSRVRVTMQDTGASVVVLVNDRMGSRNAVIDLSRGAAQQIGLYGRGRGVVSIAATDDEPVEVAEATEAEEDTAVINPSPHGLRRRRHGGRLVAADRRCCHAPSVILARHSVQHRVIRRRL
jgi:rare lipoprotein A (peptidoglycan hydrolase)